MILARDLLHKSKDEIWALDKGAQEPEWELRFDDGVVHTTGRKLIFSYYFWKFHRCYPQTPLLKKHHIGNRLLGADVYLNLMTESFWSCYDAVKTSADLNIEDLMKLAYEVANEIYNDFTLNLEEYVTSISILDFLECADHPIIKEANELVRPNSETETNTITHTHNRIKKVLLDENELVGNGVAYAAKTKLVSIGQILQCVGPRGYVTDIDNTIFKNPVLTGFFEGLTNLEDHMKESRSAAKALFFTKKPMEQSEYLNRNIQLLCATLENLHHGDCGSTYTMDFLVGPEDLEALDGIYYKTDNGLEAITKNHKHLIGKLIKIRTVFGCQHPDPVGICSTCFGELALSIPNSTNTNIGHTSAAVLQSKVGQSILSTKHEDGNATAIVFELDDYKRKYIAHHDDGGGNLFALSPRLKGKRFTITIFQDEAPALQDVIYVDNVGQLGINRISELTLITFTVQNRDREEEADVAVSSGSRAPSLTHEALDYIKKKGWTINYNGDYVIDMSEWDFDKPFLEMPMKHYSMVDHMKAVETAIKGGGKGKGHRLVDYDTPEEALMFFYRLVSSKLKVSLSHLQVIVMSTMVKSMKDGDYSIPKPAYTGELAPYRKIMKMRSLAPAMAYQGHASVLRSPTSYVVKVRPSHPMDSILIPPDKPKIYASKRRQRR